MCIGMYGFQSFQRLFQARRERFIGLVHICKKRVAACIGQFARDKDRAHGRFLIVGMVGVPAATDIHSLVLDRKSTRLNSSHVKISYAVFCLKKKKNTNRRQR